MVLRSTDGDLRAPGIFYLVGAVVQLVCTALHAKRRPEHGTVAICFISRKMTIATFVADGGARKSCGAGHETNMSTASVQPFYDSTRTKTPVHGLNFILYQCSGGPQRELVFVSCLGA